MRHRHSGRKLNRTDAHRNAMFQNMAVSLVEHEVIKTTLPKAKELRPFVERLVTLAKKASVHQEKAAQFATSAERNSSAWKDWRNSDEWQKWNQAIAPAVSLRRRAFSMLRDKEAVSILFDELADRFADRAGGYTRVVRLAEVRLGDAGAQALIEFVGERDRAKLKKKAAPVVEDDAPAPVVEEEKADDSAAADAPDDAENDAAESAEENAADGEKQ